MSKKNKRKKNLKKIERINRGKGRKPRTFQKLL